MTPEAAAEAEAELETGCRASASMFEALEQELGALYASDPGASLGSAVEERTLSTQAQCHTCGPVATLSALQHARESGHRVVAVSVFTLVFDGSTTVVDEEESAMTDGDVIRKTLEQVGPRGMDLMDTFYSTLFMRYPTVRPLFPDSMEKQKERLLSAIVTVATHADEPDKLTPTLQTMGRKHARDYHTIPEHYNAVGECLLAALELELRESFTPEVEGAWKRVYTWMAGEMIKGAQTPTTP